MRLVKLDFTTSSGGAATVLFEDNDIVGKVYAVQFVNGTTDTTTGITVTMEEGDLSIPILTKTGLDADAMFYPRVLENLNTDGTALTTHCVPIAIGQPKVVVATGGDVKTGAVILYIEDELI
jgi:hypothetical protein